MNPPLRAEATVWRSSRRSRAASSTAWRPITLLTPAGEGGPLRGGALRHDRPRDGLRLAVHARRAYQELPLRRPHRAHEPGAGPLAGRGRRPSPRRGGQLCLSTPRRAGWSRRRSCAPVDELSLARRDAAGARRAHGRRRPARVRGSRLAPQRCLSSRTAPLFAASPDRRRHRRRRARLHHEHDRLPGDRHRSVATRADRHLHVPVIGNYGGARHARIRRRPARAIIAREITNYAYNRAARRAGSTGSERTA